MRTPVWLLGAALASTSASADVLVNLPTSSADEPWIAAIDGGEWMIMYRDLDTRHGFGRFSRWGTRTFGPSVPGYSMADYPGEHNFAWNGTHAGWPYEVSRGTYLEEWFHLLDRDGNMASTPVEIAPTSPAPGPPDIVWTGSEFHVSYVTDFSPPREVRLRRVSSSGAPLGNEVVVLPILPGGPSVNPQMAAVGNVVTVATEYDDGSGGYHLYTVFLDSQGNVTIPATDAVAPRPGYKFSMSGIVSWTDRLGIAFKQYEIATSTYGLLEQVQLDTNGAPLLGPQVIGAGGTIVCCGVTSAPGGWGLAHGALGGGTTQVFLQRTSRDGTVSSDLIQVSDLPPGLGVDGPKIAYQDRTYGAVWEDYRDDADGDVRFDIAPGHEVLALGAGPSPSSRPEVKLLQPERTGGPAVATVVPYGAPGYGANVGAGDLDGNEDDELLTGPGPGDGYGPQVRAFTWRGVPKPKVNFYAYGTLRYGVKVGGCRLDADPYHEILTTPGPGAVFGPHVRAFDFDGNAVQAIAKVSFYAYGTLKYGANASGGDVDGDRYAEVLTGPGPGAVFGAQLRGFNYDGVAVASMAKINADVYPGRRYGLHVAAGDTDWEGFDEIGCSAGPDPAADTRIVVYDYDGVSLAEKPGSRFEAFAGSLGGARVSFCQGWDGDVNRELLVSRGPVPGSSAEARVADDASAGFVLASPFDPYPGQTHGSTLSSLFVGF